MKINILLNKKIRETRELIDQKERLNWFDFMLNLEEGQIQSVASRKTVDKAMEEMLENREYRD